MGDQFGFQPQELVKIQRDWQQLNEKMNAMGKRVAEIRAKVAQAAATDVASGSILGIVGAAVIVARIQGDVKNIAERAAALEATKQKLTEELGKDAEKIKMVIDAYEAVERGIADGLKQVDPGGDKQKPPKTGIDSVDHGGGGGGGGKGSGGGGGGTGGGGGGGGTGGGGGHDTPTPGNDGPGTGGGPGGKHDGGPLKDRSRGDWSTRYLYGAKGWEDWPSKHHPHKTNGHGDGVITAPKLDGLPDDRKGIVERALERAERKLGYSQSAETNGYRVDCSGLVSCAWGLPGPGLDTYGLMKPSVSHQIGKGDLQPGDAMIAGDHTLIFGGWANAAHTEYIGIEDSGSAGCVSHKIPYPYFHGDTSYHPYRRNGVE